MADETIIEPVAEPSPAQQRITQLSEKVRLTAEERDEQSRLLSEESTKRISAEKERDFYQGFSDVVTTHPAAKDHKDDILAKVKSGYTVQDATFAVLGAANKLGPAQAPQPMAGQVAGGSASTTPPQGGVKSVSEMSQAERREALEKELMFT